MLSSKTLEQHMRTIPGGSIQQRDDRLGKSWTTHLQPFLCCALPVTQNFYTEVLGKSHFSKTEEGHHPAHTISWFDAVHFCNALSKKHNLPARYIFTPQEDDVHTVPDSNGFRLLTESEWEFACRAGTNGPSYGPIDEIAWYQNNAKNSTHPVGVKQSNQWGLYDMLGNVWEWCEDVYDPAVYGTYRIFRGGGWADEERGCLVTNRRRSHPTFAIDDLGFRIARSLG